MFKSEKRVAHPDWLEYGFKRYVNTYEIYKIGHLPKQLEIFMLMTPLQYSMRSILGKSNIGCALWILRKEIEGKLFPILHPMIWLEARRHAREDALAAEVENDA